MYVYNCIYYLLSLAIFNFRRLSAFSAISLRRTRKSLALVKAADELVAAPLLLLLRALTIPPIERRVRPRVDEIEPRPRYVDDDGAPAMPPPRNRRGGILFGGPMLRSLERGDIESSLPPPPPMPPLMRYVVLRDIIPLPRTSCRRILVL